MFWSKWNVYITNQRMVLFFLCLALLSLLFFMCLKGDYLEKITPVTLMVIRARSGQENKTIQTVPLQNEFRTTSSDTQDKPSSRLIVKTLTLPVTRTKEVPSKNQKINKNIIIHQGSNSPWNDKKAKQLLNENKETPDSNLGLSIFGVFSSPFISSPSDTSFKSQDLIKPKFANKYAAKEFLIASIPPCLEKTTGCVVNSNITFQRCDYKNCKYTYNYNQAHAIMFLAPKIEDENFIPKFIRPPGQIWIMRSSEAACRYRNFEMFLDIPRLRGQFNWTFTYRLDSDYRYVYGELQRLEKPPVKDFESIYKTKKFNSAWFVSHCPTQSKRMLYVQRMTNVIEVHIYGACGDRNCSDPMGRNPRTSDNEVCFPLLSKRYFFYLAFENSLCKDYVTEKFFKIFKNVDIIPVVRGGVDYHSYFPPNTFVDASDFESPEKLAEYLEDLAKDKKRYIQMLKAKNNYRTVALQKDVCEICKRLNNKIKPKTYPDLRNWFVKDQCHPPYDL